MKMKTNLCTSIRTARLVARFVVTMLLCAAGVRAAEPTFTDVTVTLAADLPQAWVSSVTWADYDNDGLLDFFMTSSDSFRSQLWRNTGNGFTNVTATVAPGLPGSTDSVRWVDYDNDGLLDFLMTGQPQPDSDMPMARLWRNMGGKFTNVTASVAPGLPGVDGAVAWGDYDNDGRLDLLLAGGTDNGDAGYDIISQLWRNTEHGFTNVMASVLPGLPLMYPASVAWADYDNDGRLDFLITGQTNRGVFSAVSQLWRNTGSGFTNVTASVAPGLPDVSGSSMAWGDYDNDGRLDFLITGQTNWGVFSAVSQLWRNTGSRFANVTDSIVPGLPQGGNGSVAWGDYDNDGRLDFFIAGQLWQNTGSGFTNVTGSVLPGLPQGGYASVAWGDYDNDGRLDFLIWGSTNNDGFCQIWRNNVSFTNTPPSAPTGLALTATANAVMLSWNSATDAQTSASGLTYNVRAGTTPGGNNLLSAHVNVTNGFRRVPAMGNAMLRHSLPLTGLTNGQTVYWSVQAVDTAFAGGPFATETSVVSLPVLSVSIHSQPSTLNLSWAPPTFGWVLQQSPTLSVSNWTSAPSGSANPATLPATNGAQFYRLSKP